MTTWAILPWYPAWILFQLSASRVIQRLYSGNRMTPPYGPGSSRPGELRQPTSGQCWSAYLTSGDIDFIQERRYMAF